ncbi:MAG: MoxR family ATPase [Phycisphaeraceae bacterium]|nr:MoxR family ATPase [Phycisphaeraceae bacterium]
MSENPDPDVVAQAEEFRDAYRKVREQIARVIVGHDEIIDGVLTCLFVGGHALLEGVPGLGKTLLIRSLSEALSLDFSRVQFTPDLMPADITGTTVVIEDPATGERTFRFQKGPIFSQIVLADEINRATPKTQSALLEAMQERSVTVAGETHAMKPPFFVMATQNPIEQEGTYPLPEAQLDRFLYKLWVGYSSREQLHEIIERTTKAESPTIEPVLDGEKILGFQRLVREAVIAPTVQDYAIRAVLATHPESDHALGLSRQFLRFGASPRAAQALVLAGKCHALLDGRVHASVDDVRRALLPALRHRVLLNFEGEAEGISADMVIEEIRENLPAEADRTTGAAS